ncbi:pyridoxamine 5'-phosphate oxidase family protein [Tomitella cavernea]|uniref:Pyridoxamine 5'-phosphate oxidase putative domain-containing protein n=1 Tax=Tomitella cavernea TaxID=1387982 RepID=A0ABP9CNU9_9ACTN|nr:pyridoxamine 5'-phosphate oxidase family protein [Tomitella cavernea]
MTDRTAAKPTPATLEQALPGYRSAYLLTVSDAARPHVVEVSARLAAGLLEVRGHGRRSTSNAQARPEVTVLWPATDPGGRALIVDGRASVAEDRLFLTVARAILHRSGEAAGDATPADACTSDCVELSFARP